MKVIELSEYRDEEGIISLKDRIQGTLRHGLGWYGLIQTQEVATRLLSKSLDKAHVLIRNVTLPGTSIVIPLILLSPQGARVIEANPVVGVFRAKGEDWLKFDSRSRSFKRTRPNLQLEVIKNAQLVHRYLEHQGYPLPDVEPVLLLTNPRGHVDTARPTARIVQSDAIDHFAANILELPPIMDQEDISLLTEALINPRPSESEPELEPEPEPEPLAEPEPAPEIFLETEETITTAHEAPIPPRQISIRLGGLRLSKRQWILLGVITFFEIVILIIFAMVLIRDYAYT
jgi:hypothetical protein